MNIDDLHKSVTDMTDEELHELLRDLRFNRRQAPEKPVKAKAKAEVSNTPKKPNTPKQPEALSAASAMAVLGSLTKEQKLALLKDMMK